MKRLAQPRADKVVQNVGKVPTVNTFPDGLAYTPKWLVAEHRQIKVVRRGNQPRSVYSVRSTSKDIDYSKVVIRVKLEKEKK
ncbi:hypothetical protein [Enterococcus cecorum]|uniref:hypothetical protein n=1 Tax=Enterococcus cecorum TaxID=44008 RepID=UPI000640E307|nr:hypothetical protein [Enterococcus cecorum]KLN94365.1 hypothetical protein ABT60_04620 [Enterococcus cecorum]KLN94421.1 hypothetical protein ABT59_00790 [Enterococcus cecorum]